MTKPRPVHFAADEQPGTSLCGALTRKRTEVAADVTCADCLAHPRLAAPVSRPATEAASVARFALPERPQDDAAFLAERRSLKASRGGVCGECFVGYRHDKCEGGCACTVCAKGDAQALAQCTGSTSVTVRHERRELDGSLTLESVVTASAPKLDRALFRSLVAQGYSREHATKRATR